MTLYDAVKNLLAQADSEIAALRPVCRASGRCCKFEEYGHRLYVTRAEQIYFARAIATDARAGAPEPQGGQVISLPQFFASAAPRGCPYQVDGLCTARDARPLGCRVYFCDENAQQWQNDLYERYHAELCRLHEAFGVPYEYVEWRAALQHMMDAGELPRAHARENSV